MILKASQRSGGQNLAAHLMRTDENEHVEVHEMRGFIADDLHGAFKEAYAISRATKCKQYLFSLSLNPPQTENVPVEAFEKAIEQIETRLGLTDQPRAIVFHEKEGRRHAHCVWSRIDGETMTAKQMSFFKGKLQKLSRDLYLEHGWKMPRGLMDKQQRDPRNFTLAEWQQAKRSGQDPRQIKSVIQDCWAVSDGRASFEQALNEKGFWLAKGDRRGFVAVDYTGEVYAIARATGRKAKEVKERLGTANTLKSVHDTKCDIAAALTPKIQDHIRQARLHFKNRSATLAHNKTMMTGVHQSERRTLYEQHKERHELETKARAAKLPRGIKAVWSKITGTHKKLISKNEREVEHCAARDRGEKNALIARQLSERRELQKQINASRLSQAELLQELRQDTRRFISMSNEPPDQSQDQTRQQRRYRNQTCNLSL